jgi:hypothetical protein
MLIRRAGQKWRSPEMTTYPSEGQLQRLLARSPELLPGDLGPLATGRELGVPTGSVDVVAVGVGGELLLCECKLERNEQARRMVVGQIFSYAASVSGMTFEEFDIAFRRSAGSPVAEAVAEVAGPEWDEEAFRQGLTDALDEGAFTLVVAVDHITDELKRTIRFLNRRTNESFRVLALELAYKRDGEIEIVVPQTYGEDSPPPTVGRRRRWTQADFLEALNRTPLGLRERTFRVFEELSDFATEMRWGTGRSPSATFDIPFGGEPQSLFSLYTSDNGAHALAVNFDFFHKRVPPELVQELLERVEAWPGGVAAFRERGFNSRPGVKCAELLATDGGVEAVIETARWAASGAGSSR